MCIQTFSIVDLRTLIWSGGGDGGDRLFLPYAQGVVTDCTDFIGDNDLNVCGAAHPELGGDALERSEQTWVPNGGERSMGWMALLVGSSPAPPPRQQLSRQR